MIGSAPDGAKQNGPVGGGYLRTGPRQRMDAAMNEQFRRLGKDPVTGRTVFVQRGGAIEAAVTVEAAYALHCVVSVILDAGQATDEELSAFVPALNDALGEILDALAPNDEPLFGAAAVAVRNALQGGQR
jgi:hypothetical protein